MLVGESLHRDCSHHSRLGSRVSTRNQKPARCVFQRTARVTYSHQQGPASQSSPTKIKLPARDQVLKLWTYLDFPIQTQKPPLVSFYGLAVKESSEALCRILAYPWGHFPVTSEKVSWSILFIRDAEMLRVATTL